MQPVATKLRKMKFFLALVFASIALASGAGWQWGTTTQASNPKCNVPCTVTKTLVCATNGQCPNMFLNNCQMEKWNCVNNDNFYERPSINCLTAQNCKHIPASFS